MTALELQTAHNHDVHSPTDLRRINRGETSQPTRVATMDLLRPLLPWLLLLVLFCVFGKLYGWARRRKTGAFVFGALTQMLLPDPYAERTLKIVQERKQETRREQDKNGDRNSDEQQESGTPAPDMQPSQHTAHDTQQVHDSGCH